MTCSALPVILVIVVFIHQQPVPHIYINITCVHNMYIIKSPKQRLETYCFCSVSYYYYSYSSYFPCTMNLSTADLNNYRTEFHETAWSYRYMFLVDPKVFRFVVKGVKAIFWGLLQNPMGNLKFRTLMLITSNWIMIET